MARVPIRLIGVSALLCVLTTPFDVGGGRPATGRRTAAKPALPLVQIEMRNVHLRFADGIALDVRHLRGEMISTTPGEPPFFDDQRSYTLRVHTADAAITTASLTTLMNESLFAYEGAPFKDLTISTDEARLKMKGKLNKAIDVPFTVSAVPEVAPDGRLRLRATKIEAAGIPAKGLMKFFGLELDDIVSLEKRRGVAVEDNDLLLVPGRILPPPRIEGHLERVRVSDGRLHQTFTPAGTRVARLDPPDPKANYVFFRSGVIRFGKLTMHDTDLQLIDADPSDPFDFYPSQYLRQLIAGYSKTMADGGLKTFMPDFGDLAAKGAPRTAATTKSRAVPPQ